MHHEHHHFGPPPQWFIKRRGLKYLILYLLSSRGPMTGAQIIDEIERLSMGFWRPSPGSVYPALEELEADGLIKVAKVEGTKKYYEITESGKAFIGLPNIDKTTAAVNDFVSLARYIIDNWDTLSETDKSRIRDVLKDLIKAAGIQC
ncbi:PadR family transcriptional regulator [Vulcanisaeta sp. JCM 14467]|uniref:PadR family transcriptional regulator n=1 Tax=Vulcanisaeta sp. JCM 14467 TaxID=1295370 RepID=UPI0006CFC4EB|nr:PadR family transcriptional regulator [Vulcanisaeta sp. JCM 14467]